MLDIKIANIDVGIKQGNPVAFILKEIEILNVHQITDSEKIERLETEEIDGYIDDDLTVWVKKSGINQTIIKEIIEQIKQMQKLNRPIESYDFNVDYVLKKNQKANPVIIIFYSLITMASTYGVFSGIVTVSLIQANLSNIGARINITPLKKYKFLLAGVFVALFLNLLSNEILLLFIKYVLKIQLFRELKYSTIFVLLGNILGVALGILIGASNKRSSNTKILMGVAVTLFLSFLSGMMGPDIKIIIDQYVPILSRINPMSIITNNLYRVNLLENTKNVGEGIFILAFYSVFLLLISYLFLKGRNYDSL